MKIPFKKIAKSITGISTPVFGIQWNPSASERDIARKLITFLEDRRALYSPTDFEMNHHVQESIIEIRKKLTEILESLDEVSEIAGNIRALRASCRKFLDQVFALRGSYRHEDDFFALLGELRGVFGIHIAQISVKYGINIEKDLAKILPITDDENKDNKS